MERPYQFILVERLEHAFAIRLLRRTLDDAELEALGGELARLLDEDGCRNLIVNLGPEDPECLYSVFLAQLVSLKKRLERVGGTLALASMTPHAEAVFQAAGIARFFVVYPDQDQAIKALSRTV